MAFGRGGRRGGDGPDQQSGRNGQGGRRAFGGGTPSPEAEALQKAVESKASADELKAKLAQYREARKEKQAKLEKAQDELRQLLSLFPARILLKEQLLPLRRTNGTVEVATSRLFATQGLDALKTMTGLRLKPVLAPTEAIEREMKKRLGVGADTIDTLDEEAPFQVVDENKEDTNLDSAAEDASIIRFVNQVLKDAIELRASDIHLEPFEDELRIRYRIDGVLQEVPVPAQVKRFQPAIVSRVKILSHLNIAEKRLPQDG